MKTAAQATVNAVMSDYADDTSRIARRGDRQRTIAFVPKNHTHYARLARNLKPIDGDIAGIVIVETLVRHPDALSVSGGYYLQSTDDRAPRSKLIHVRANADGSPNVDHLCRDGGALDVATRGAWA